jgi:hypothetical protein
MRLRSWETRSRSGVQATRAEAASWTFAVVDACARTVGALVDVVAVFSALTT